MGEAINWSDRQQKVIDLRKRNILVSAAAGSGKTAVLVERIITMITEGENPVDIDHLLIVTFTNAAAAEMRERIGEAIQERLIAAPDHIHLQKQLTLLHSAQITTIHSFCLHVIRNHFHRIDLDPGFRIGDEAELTLMKSDVAEAVLEQHYEEGDPRFLSFIECYAAGKSDLNMESLMLQLYGFSRSYPWPKRWLTEQNKLFSPENQEEMEQSAWMKFFFQYLRKILFDLSGKAERAYQICLEPDGPHPYERALADDIEMLRDLAGLSAYGDYYQIFLNLKFTRLSGKKDETVSTEKKEQVKAIRDSVKKSLDGIAKNFFYQPPEEMFRDLTGVRESMEVLIDLTLEFAEQYQAKKEEKNMVDFNDLEHFALQILTREENGGILPSEAAEEFSEYFEEILVDEYQDSNLVQETILNSITRERNGQPNFFMVGDVKQSIYKFRLARPELFMEKYETYTNEDSLYQKIDLFENYRSRPHVLSGVNYLFERMMRKELGNIDYTEEAALHRGGDFKECSERLSDSTELLILTKETEEEAEEDSEEVLYTEREIEAKAIAKRIFELTHPETGLNIWDKREGKYRIAENRDIVILLRTMSGFADVFVETLLGEGILACADTQTGYFSTFEIQIVLNMLRILDNPRQDIPLASVLLSQIGGFTELELAEIKVSVAGGDLYQSMKKYEENVETSPLFYKVEAFFYMLDRYREMTGYLPIHKLIRLILEETHFQEYVQSMPGGERRAANVSMLVKRAVLFEESSYHGLFHFIRYIEKLHKYEVDFGEAGVSGEQENTVRLMSIHKSKGLEFPIVFVAGLGKMFNQQDARSKIALHSEMGIGPDYVDPVRRIKSPTLLKKVIQKQIALENLGEELRVLYVALTRAKEKLILTGMVKNLKKSLSGIRDKAGMKDSPLSFQTLESAKNYMDWVLPALFYHPACASVLSPEEYRESPDRKKCTLPSYEVKISTLSDFVTPAVLTHLVKKKTREELEHFDVETVYDAGIREEIARRFLFAYPYQAETKIHIKATVTERKKQANSEQTADAEPWYEQSVEEEDSVIPRFAGGESIQTGSARGSLYHYVLEHLPRLYIKEKEELLLALDLMVEQGSITSEEKSLIQLERLWTFTKSDLAKRMEQAKTLGTLREERPFVIGIPACELYPDTQSEEPVLLQGIMDAYFEEDGKWILVDYKTDRIPEGADGREYLTVKYKEQLSCYERALWQITKKPVAEKIIYSFGMGEAVKL